MSDTATTSPRPGGTYEFAGRTVARVGYGAMSLERHDGDRAAGERLVRRALDFGVDHIDTADFYGDAVANEIIRGALAAAGTSADSVLVASKVGAVRTEGPIPLRPAQRPEELRASVEHNLATLGLDRLDVVNLRRLDVGPGITATGDQVVDLDDQLAEMTAMRDEGLIGGVGLSAVDTDVLRRGLPAGIACVQNAYALVSREFEDMLELCVAEGIAWVPFFPLGSAFPGRPKVQNQPEVVAIAERLGATPSQVGLAWLLAHAPNTLLIPGTGSEEHLVENVAAGDLALDATAVAELDAIWAARFAGTDQEPRWTD